MLQVLILVRQNWVVLTLASLLLITTLSLWPQDELPMVPGGDKVHHFIAYAFLMFPVALRKPKKWIWVAVGFVAYSGAIELIQPYVNRYGEWLDMAANTAGIVSGICVAELLRWAFPIKNRNPRI
jgi:VanZ family protein